MNKFTFRVWNKFIKKFVDMETWKPDATFQNFNDSINGNNFDFQLSSGKLDKNGEEIYQGDILKFNNKSEYCKEEYWFPIYEVTWTGISFGLKYLGGGKTGDAAMFRFEHYSNNFQVMGNIFESTIIIPKNS